MRIAKLVLGILSIVFSPVCFYFGSFLSLFLFGTMLAGGIVSTAENKRRGGSIACFILYLISSIIGLYMKSLNGSPSNVFLYCLFLLTVFHLIAMVLPKKFYRENTLSFCIHCGSLLQNRTDLCESCGCVLNEEKLMRTLQFGDEEGFIHIRTHDPMLEYGLAKFKTDIYSANSLLHRLHESVMIMEETINPDTFFKRLHYSFDVMLELMTYRDEVFNNNCTPEQQYWLQYDFIETRVNNFLDRSYSAVLQQCRNLKTAKGINNRLKNWYMTMEVAFESCDTFWLGSSGMPHYRGMLYTPLNREKLKGLEQTCLRD